MEPHHKGHPSHGRPSSSQDYRYPPASTHHFPPGPGPSFQHAYAASLIAAGHPEQQQQQQAAMLHHQRDVITRLPPRIDNRIYQQADSLAVIPGNVDPLDHQRTDAFKKQALAANPYFYHPNFAVASSAVDHLQASLGVAKECPPNLVIGSAIAMDNAPLENTHMVSNMDMASSTSSPSTCTSLQPPNNPEATSEPSTNVDPMTRKEDVIAGSVKEPSAFETAELRRLKYAPKANSLIQTLLRKGGQPPEGLSYDQYSEDPNDVRVIATRSIEPGQVYGPLKGNVKTLDCLHNTQAWELCLDGMVAAYIAPTPRKEWMGYVRNAHFLEEYNLEAGQVYGRIYFTVIRRIEPGAELKVFYSDVYRENCGFMYDLAALNYNKDTDSFSCTMCNVKIDNSKSMVRHYKVTHPDDGLQEEKALPLKVAERLKLLNAQCKLPPQYEEEEEEEDEETQEDNTEATEKNNDGQDPTPPVQKEPSTKNVQGVQGNHSAKRKMQDDGDSQRFICPTCGKNFPTHGRLVMHESFHGGDDEADNDSEEDDFDDNGADYRDDGDGFKCPICGFTFDNEHKFKVHKKKHKTHRFMCKQCGNLYTRKTYMYRHQRELHGGVYIRARRNVNAFMQNYTAGKSPEEKTITGKESAKKNAANRCNICNYVARSQGLLGEHMAQHRDKPYGCEKCGCMYAGRSKLYKHLRLKHGASQERFLTPQRRENILKYLAEQTVQGIRCKECGFTCRDEKSLQEHRQTHKYPRRASDPQALRDVECCEMCGFKTADEERFTEHINKHVTYPHGCRKCGNTYMTKKSLLRHHQEKHQGQYLDNKDIDRSIGRRATLTHARHKNACPKCAFYTPQKAVLQKHISKHRRFPYGCIECGIVYTRNSTLRRHQRAKHLHLFTGEVAQPNKDEISGLLESVTSPENLQVQGNTCPRCGFQTPDKNFLTDHVILHLTHPHGCNVCGNVYTKRKFMVRHRREKHPEALVGDGDVAPEEGDKGSASDMGRVEDGSEDDGSISGEDHSGQGDREGNDYYGRDDGIDGEDHSGEDHSGELDGEGNDYYGRDDGIDGEEGEEAEMEGGEEYSDESEGEYDDDDDIEDEV